jgi:uncharacterized protein involved in response to NO
MFAHGFRPFFLFAGLYAVFSMLVWLVWMGLHLVGGEVLGSTIAFPLYQWHAHEMLFGFVTAVVAGFLLTAVPNWTKEPALHGAPLAILVCVWLAGRLAVSFSAFFPSPIVVLVDFAFLPLLGIFVVPSLIRARNRRNFVFMALLAVLAAANLLADLELTGITPWGAAEGELLAINLVVLLIALVGGRIVPSFTANWLSDRGSGAQVRNRPWLDRLTLLATVAVLVVDLATQSDAVRGGLALTAAIVHLLRLAGWQSMRTAGAPILWVLHLGYAWLVIGFACKALALLAGALPEVAAMHAFMAGTAGTMTLGVMSRAALGHTGRPLEVATATAVAYGLVSLSAIVRIIGPALAPDAYVQVMLISGAAWVLAFGLFVAVYWPVLTRPRADGLPG